jgi:hypothetical protein
MKQNLEAEQIDIGCVPLDELRLVHGATQFISWDSDSMAGPIVRCENDRRVWEITDEEAVIVVYGENCSFEGTFMFGRQFIENCLPLGRLDDNIQLTVVDRKVTATSPSGSLTMLCGPTISRFEGIHEIDSTTARLPFRQMFRAFDTASDLPSNISEHVIQSNPDAPATVIAISEGNLSCSTDWRPYGSHTVSTTTSAEALGTGTIALNAQMLNRLIHTIGFLGNPEFTVSFDQLTGEYVKISSQKVFIALKRMLVGADAIHFQIRETLDQLVQKNTTNERGNIIAVVDDRPITINVLERDDGNSHLIRISNTIIRGATPTLDLLNEINVFNRMLPKNKVWMDEDRVCIGVDIDGTEAIAIYSHLRSIVSDAEKLDGLLQPLCA